MTSSTECRAFFSVRTSRLSLVPTMKINARDFLPHRLLNLIPKPNKKNLALNPKLTLTSLQKKKKKRKKSMMKRRRKNRNKMKKKITV